MVLSPFIPLFLALAVYGDDALDDEELARRIRRGDREAFRTLFERYHGMLYGYLRRRGVGPAVCEDLSQQAFITIWERRADIDPQKSLRAFLFKIGYHRALNHFRDTSKFKGDEELVNAPGRANPEAQAEYALMQETLGEVVAQLPERRRAVFEATALAGIAYRFPRQRLEYDSSSLQITNVSEANNLVYRNYREGWEV